MGKDGEKIQKIVLSVMFSDFVSADQYLLCEQTAIQAGFALPNSLHALCFNFLVQN